MNIYNNIKELCDQRGITTYRLCKDLGFSTALMSQWKAGRQNPSGRKLRLIADYFGVPIERLMVGRDYRTEAGEADPDLQELLEDIKANPDLMVLFSKTRNASRRDIEKVIKMLEIIKGEDEDDIL